MPARIIRIKHRKRPKTRKNFLTGRIDVKLKIADHCYVASSRLSGDVKVINSAKTDRIQNIPRIIPIFFMMI